MRRIISRREFGLGMGLLASRPRRRPSPKSPSRSTISTGAPGATPVIGLAITHTRTCRYSDPEVSFATFSDDLLRGERIVSGFPGFQKMFRFPFLKEGETAAKRIRCAPFLTKHGYRNGHLTDGATYYDGLAQSMTGRTILHTILLHYTLLNSLFLDAVLTMFEAKGLKLVNAQTAYQDTVFLNLPRIVPAGESLIWAMAKESGKFEGELRYSGEDGEYEKDKLDRLGL